MQPNEPELNHDQAKASPIAGWYPDPTKQPDQLGRLRYWDGQQWTNHLHSPEQTHGSREKNTELPQGTAKHNQPRAAEAGPGLLKNAKSNSIFTSHPEIDKYPAFLVGTILWAVAGLWGVIAPVAARIMQANAIKSAFDISGSDFTYEERMYGQVFGTLTNAAASWATGPLFAFWAFIAFCALIGYGLIVFFLVRGSSNARVVGTVLTGVSLIPLLITGVPGIVQIALNAGGLALIWRTSSTEYLNAAYVRTQANKARRR